MATTAQKKAINKYNKKTYKQVKFIIKQIDENILNNAVASSGLSKNAYIKQALNKQLIEDGFEPLK